MYWLTFLMLIILTINPAFSFEESANLTRKNLSDIRELFENKENIFEKLTFKTLKICHNSDLVNESIGTKKESLLEVKGFVRNQGKSWGYEHFFETKDDYEFYGSERDFFDASVEDKKIKGMLTIEYGGQDSGRKRKIDEKSILITFTLGSIQAKLVSTDYDRAQFQYAGGSFEVILGEKECVTKPKIINKNRAYFKAKDKDEANSAQNKLTRDNPAKVISR